MNGALVDSNVLLDVLTDDATWANWSRGRIADAAEAGGAFASPVAYAEASVGFRSVEAFDAALARLRVEVQQIPRAALFLAAKVHQAYRRRGGARAAILPDFLVGAHAAVARLPLLTRDARRYRTNFPTVRLIAP